MSRLLRLLSLLYRFADEEVDSLADRLLEARKRAWRTALTEAARRYGWAGPVRDPSLADLAELRRMARADAESIARTWARDIERQLQRLYAAHPRGNRYYYIKRMEAWAEARARWKNRDIARETEQTTRSFAQALFYQRNGLRGGLWRLEGLAPVCDLCVELMALGLVGQVVVDRHPMPAHFGCTHEWVQQTISVPAPPAYDLWVG